MKKRISAALMATLFLGCMLAMAQQPKPAARVGVYDSRAIAVAYMRSETFRQSMQPIREEYNQAKAANDEKRMKAIDTQMRSAQALAHQQGFSTASVMTILDKIKNQIPTIAQEAGVSLIVSKWELAYRDPAIEYVDVTMQLVKPFQPDQQTLQIIEQLKKNDPVPLDKLAREQ